MKAEVVLRQFGLVEQPGISQVGRQSLGSGGAGRHAAADVAPKIGLPRNVERQVETFSKARCSRTASGSPAVSGGDGGSGGHHREQGGAGHADRCLGLRVCPGWSYQSDSAYLACVIIHFLQSEAFGGVADYSYRGRLPPSWYLG